jgi:hypothetical protein
VRRERKIFAAERLWGGGGAGGVCTDPVCGNGARFGALALILNTHCSCDYPTVSTVGTIMIVASAAFCVGVLVGFVLSGMLSMNNEGALAGIEPTRPNDVSN